MQPERCGQSETDTWYLNRSLSFVFSWAETVDVSGVTLPKASLKHEGVLILPTSLCGTASLPIPLMIP